MVSLNWSKFKIRLFSIAIIRYRNSLLILSKWRRNSAKTRCYVKNRFINFPNDLTRTIPTIGRFFPGHVLRIYGHQHAHLLRHTRHHAGLHRQAGNIPFSASHSLRLQPRGWRLAEKRGRDASGTACFWECQASNGEGKGGCDCYLCAACGGCGCDYWG